MTNTDRIENLLDRFVETVKPPGLAAAVIHNGALMTVYEYGYADLQTQRPVTPGTRFNLGLLTQVLTAAAVLRADVPLHTPVNDLLGRAAITNAATPHHLLTHTAGLGAARSLRALLRSAQPPPTDALLNALLTPGEKWAFSRNGYALLAQVLAAHTRQSAEQAITAQVFAPLAITRTDFTAPETTAYKKNGKPITDSGAWGASGSVNDLISVVGAILSDRLLTADQRALMFTAHYQLDDQLPGMGYAFRLDHLGDQPIAWINSDIEGYSAAVWLAPATETAVIALMNTRRDGVLAAIARKIISGLLDIDETPPAQTPEPSSLAADCVGYYAPKGGLLTNLELWAAYGGGVSVSERRGQLRINGQIDPAATRPLYPTDDALTFRYQSAGGMPLLVFKRGAGGRVDRLCIGLYELHRTAYWRSLGGRLMLFVAVIAVIFVLILLLIGGA